MKTAEQVAVHVANGYHRSLRHTAYSAAHEAITTDRAQRAVTFGSLDAMLSAYEQYDGDMSAFLEVWSQHFNEGAELPDWAVWHA